MKRMMKMRMMVRTEDDVVENVYDDDGDDNGWN